VFGLDAGYLRWLGGSKSEWLKYYEVFDNAEIINKWKKEASQKDRVYILSGVDSCCNGFSDTVYYIED
jgi:hypothetical protein